MTSSPLVSSHGRFSKIDFKLDFYGLSTQNFKLAILGSNEFKQNGRGLDRSLVVLAPPTILEHFLIIMALYQGSRDPP